MKQEGKNGRKKGVVHDSVALWALDCELWCLWANAGRSETELAPVLRYPWTKVLKPKVSLSKGRLCSKNSWWIWNLLMPHLGRTVIGLCISSTFLCLSSVPAERTAAVSAWHRDSLCAAGTLLLAFLVFFTFPCVLLRLGPIVIIYCKHFHFCVTHFCKIQAMTTVRCLNTVPRTAAELVSGQAALLLAVYAHLSAVFESEFRPKCGC